MKFRINESSFNPKDKRNISNSGNGFAVPEYELDRNSMEIKLKVDKNGVVSTHNLYADIQKFKNVNSLERVLATASQQDIENLSILCSDEKEAAARSADYTQIVNQEEIMDFKNKLNRSGMSADDLMSLINARVEAAVKAKIKESKKTPEINDTKEVNENGEKDKK